MRRRRRYKKYIISFIICYLLFVPVISYSASKLFHKDTFLISPLAKAIQIVKSATTNPIGDIANETLLSHDESYGIVIKHLQTGMSYSHDETTSFESASLYKLWVMATVYEKLEKKQLKETTILKESVEELNKKFKLASESAELKEGEIELSVTDALKKMITVSDNYAALLLSSKIRNSSILTFLKENGFSDSKLGQPPKTTAQDTADFYEKLYKKELVSSSASEAMLLLLKQQTLNDRIPKYLPESINVAHKTGELGGYKHDAGIVFTPKGDYIIVVLSKGDDPSVATERIATFSEKLYAYFTAS